MPSPRGFCYEYPFQCSGSALQKGVSHIFFFFFFFFFFFCTRLTNRLTHTIVYRMADTESFTKEWVIEGVDPKTVYAV